MTKTENLNANVEVVQSKCQNIMSLFFCGMGGLMRAAIASREGVELHHRQCCKNNWPRASNAGIATTSIPTTTTTTTSTTVTTCTGELIKWEECPLEAAVLWADDRPEVRWVWADIGVVVGFKWWLDRWCSGPPTKQVSQCWWNSEIEAKKTRGTQNKKILPGSKLL